MMSMQFLTRNLRLRVASLRGFSSATVTEKSEIADKTQNTAKQTQSKPSRSLDLFEKLKSLDHPPAGKEQTVTRSNPTRKPSSVSKFEAGKSAVSLSSSISNATTVTELLNLSENDLTRDNAMSVLTKLSVWTASSQANVKEFENDYRFLKVCRKLSSNKASTKQDVENLVQNHQQKSAELEMVLSIAGDDEASKIVETLSLPQKVKVFASLARKKTRSIEVLKTLASTISGHTGKLNLKECSDILFAMTSLNFIDEMLLCRISMDINRGLPKNLDKTAVVGSIVTSLGFLKYKEPALLDNLTEWVINKQELCRSKDLASLLLTLALVNYRPKNFDEITTKLLPKITRDDLSANEWLDYVWALSVLELHQSTHLESILRPEFLEKLTLEQELNDILPSQKMKLLNINAVAKYLTSNYDGPFLKSDSTVNNCPLGYRKSKKILIQGLLDTLKNLFTTDSYIRTEHNTKLGFVIDAECVLNKNRMPLAVESTHKDAFRVALMVLDYHDMCKGCKNDPNGYNALAFKLLAKIGYTVLQIPHTEFSTSDKVLKRVQYLDTQLKNIVNQSSKRT
ncbi:FAST kinase domain-containing protein 4 [Sitodiplosis mosellana]|uniref:FAST kinase domain-containing protein 4 n=1 Tax=Sitodiplosis mosellana TaxID=263140 RepID=UPI002444732B|nr:FAST kinase domain-containing protein 4 [Sitodiplosis mosellana]XP_055325602.1 FAST kinase domain-containing protein 4 [Sitodiplosis mosellana]